MGNKYLFYTAFILGAIFIPNNSEGKTVIPITHELVGDYVWDAEGSPYIVDRAYFRAGSLTITEGTIVKFKSPTSTLEVHADTAFTVLGTAEKPVFFTSIKDDAVGGDTNEDGSATVPAPKDWGVFSWGNGSNIKSPVEIRHARIRYGGNVPFDDVFASFVVSIFNFSATGNIIDSIEVSHSPVGVLLNVGSGLGVSLTNASFHDTSEYAVYNATPHNSVSVVDSWWGDVTGPFHSSLNGEGLGNIVSNGIVFEPWLLADPIEDAVAVPQVSNVAFFPGLQGSRLYTRSAGTENTLWEPNRNTDVENLYLYDDGTSIDETIYTNDVIDEAFGFNIYKNFLSFLENEATAGTIHEWKAFPYDWRRDVDSVLTELIQLPDDESYMLYDEILALAERSPNGTITLVAHSNGGLLAKALIMRLEEDGKDNIIDKLILVGVPHIGTPDAIMGLLHGGERGVTKGWLPNHVVTRELGEHMQSAYDLLPSQLYFDTVYTIEQPIIEFAPVSPTEYLRGVYGEVITTFADLVQFLSGEDGARTEPSADNVTIPNVLSSARLVEAQARHDVLDSWTLPSHIQAYEIIGWGLQTMRGIRYEQDRDFECVGLICEFTEKIDPRPLFTDDGDGTVVTPSARWLEGVEEFYIHLKRHNRFGGLTRNRDHADFLEISDVQDVIKNIFENKEVSINDIILDAKPMSSAEDKTLLIRAHSPVFLEVTDADGGFIGIQSEEDISIISETIPNSFYREFGEGKYISIPANGTYTVRIIGTGDGSFTVGFDILQNSEVVSTKEYKDIPVRQGTLAHIQIADGVLEESMIIDMDGDGNTDSMIGAIILLEDRLRVLENIIDALDVGIHVKKVLHNSISNIKENLDSNKKKQSINSIALFINKVRLFADIQHITEDDARMLLYVIEQIKEEVI